MPNMIKLRDRAPKAPVLIVPQIRDRRPSIVAASQTADGTVESVSADQPGSAAARSLQPDPHLRDHSSPIHPALTKYGPASLTMCFETTRMSGPPDTPMFDDRQQDDHDFARALMASHCSKHFGDPAADPKGKKPLRKVRSRITSGFLPKSDTGHSHGSQTFHQHARSVRTLRRSLPEGSPRRRKIPRPQATCGAVDEVVREATPDTASLNDQCHDSAGSNDENEHVSDGIQASPSSQTISLSEQPTMSVEQMVAQLMAGSDVQQNEGGSLPGLSISYLSEFEEQLQEQGVLLDYYDQCEPDSPHMTGMRDVQELLEFNYSSITPRGGNDLKSRQIEASSHILEHPYSTRQHTFPPELWGIGLLDHLSSSEVRNLRLVCKDLARDIAPWMFRSVVTKFGPTLFSSNPRFDECGKLQIDSNTSIMDKYGMHINKFGVAFEFDQRGLWNAPYKETMEQVHTWFGKYDWPKAEHPYFKPLADIDAMLEDDRRLLTKAMSNLTKCKELALSVDSGHGWLPGADLSDLAIYRMRAASGSKVFGKAFDAVDIAHEHGLKTLFEWAQVKTLQDVIEFFQNSGIDWHQADVDRLRRIVVRSYDSFQEDDLQHDYEPDIHTGGSAFLLARPTECEASQTCTSALLHSDSLYTHSGATMNEAVAAYVSEHTHSHKSNVLRFFSDSYTGSVAHERRSSNFMMTGQGNQAGNEGHSSSESDDDSVNEPILPSTTQPSVQVASSHDSVSPSLPAIARPGLTRLFVPGHTQAIDSSSHQGSPSQFSRPPGGSDGKLLPQWPIIFNGYNISHLGRGDSTMSQIAKPSRLLLKPGSLTEAQAQWLMETSWIQRTFLSAYVDSVLVNSSVLSQVHSLHIAKLSSGLLPCLAQKSFWTSLPHLRKIKLLVVPDWRVAHVPGDAFFNENMKKNPAEAAIEFTEILRDYIAELHKVQTLHIGYVGGGEHQTGLFGRNQHVLPAPIVSNPEQWLWAQNPEKPKPGLSTILTFPHVRTLTFENCWFTPYMLERFMYKSRGTSLYNLVLDSASMTVSAPSIRIDGPNRTVERGLRCHHPTEDWLQETIPDYVSWVPVLDKITPGTTILEKKYDAGLLNPDQNPRLERAPRGRLQEISLKSCGYLKVHGYDTEFNQNSAVVQNSAWSILDQGLAARLRGFGLRSLKSDKPSAGGSKKLSEEFVPIMQSARTAHTTVEGHEGPSPPPLTGHLTQCIHPVEKRVIEQMWGARFGWGNDMRRWEAVEDGFAMGGTGRFSVDITKE